MKDIDKFPPKFGRTVAVAAVLIAGLLGVLSFVQHIEDAAEQSIQVATTERPAK